MTTEVLVQNVNGPNAIVIRTYRDKGNTVDDGVTIEPGGKLSIYLHDDAFIQVDEVESHAASNKQAAVEPARTEEEILAEMEANADADAAESRGARGVTKEDDELALDDELHSPPPAPEPVVYTAEGIDVPDARFGDGAADMDIDEVLNDQ